MKLTYHEVYPKSRVEIDEAIASNNATTMIEALISAAFYEPDWRWVQNLCLQLATHSDSNIRRTAITCLGHLARLHGQLDVHLVLPLLQELNNDPSLEGTVQDTLDDIRIFASDSLLDAPD